MTFTICRCEVEDRDVPLLETILDLFHAASARDVERGIPMTTVYHSAGRAYDRNEVVQLLDRLELQGLVTWVGVFGRDFRVWPTPIAVKRSGILLPSTAR
jgi:hypothetical protein